MHIIGGIIAFTIIAALWETKGPAWMLKSAALIGGSACLLLVIVCAYAIGRH
jgi:hypothetical protein